MRRVEKTISDSKNQTRYSLTGSHIMEPSEPKNLNIPLRKSFFNNFGLMIKPPCNNPI